MIKSVLSYYKPLLSTALILIFIASTTVFAQTKQEKEALASQYFHDGNFQKAALEYGSLYKNYGGSFYYTNYMNSLLEIPNYKEAETLAKKESKKHKGVFRYKVDLGHIYMLNDNFKKADKHFKNLIENINKTENQYIELSNAFLMRRYIDYSLQTLEKGIDEVGKTYSLLLSLARIYEVAGKYEEMTKAYLDIVDIMPRYLKNVKIYLQTAINSDPEGTKNTAIKNVLLERTRKYPEKTIYAELLLWHSIQNKNWNIAFIQAKSLDKRIDDQGETLFEFAQLCANINEFEIAEKAYNIIIKKGQENYFYNKSRINLLDIKFQKLYFNGRQAEKKELESLEKEYEKTIENLGKGPETIVLMQNLAHLKAFYLHDIESAINLLKETISYPSNKRLIAESKIALGDVYLISGEIWEATLLYSQVEKDFKNEPIGHKAKFKNAKFYFYIGDFDWAKAQLDVLRAATSKLIANDAMQMSLLISENIDYDSSYVPLEMYALADFLYFQNKIDDAFFALDSIEMIFPNHPISDDVLMKKAKMYFDLAEYTKTDSVLQLIVKNYPYDVLADKALYSRALLQELYLDDSEKAMELYSQLLMNYSGSLLVVNARKRYRFLRGDNKDEINNPKHIFFYGAESD